MVHAPRPISFTMSLAALIGLFLAVPSAATAVFFDGFDSELGTGEGASGGSGLNYTGFANWTVSGGSVDLLVQGDFLPGAGINCAGLSGKCVDLDGSNLNGGVLTSISILLNPGVYEISYELSGVDAGFTQTSASIPNIVDVTAGAGYSAQHTLNQGDPYSTFSGQFTILVPTSIQIVFGNQGADNFGAMLDNVNLIAIPEPGTFSLVLMGLGLLGRRRSSKSIPMSPER